MKKFCLLTLLALLLFSVALADGTVTVDGTEYEYFSMENGTVHILSCTTEATDIVVPATLDGFPVTGIEASAFSGDILQIVTLPDSIVEIIGNPFAGLPELTTIIVDPANPAFHVIDNVLFETATQTLVCYPGGLPDPSYTVPDGTRVIGDTAFSMSSYLTSITLPASVETIECYAMHLCDALTHVEIPEGLKTLKHNAFYGCSSLVSIALPDSLTTVEGNPFAMCGNLETVEVSLENPALAVIDGVLFEKTERRLLFYPSVLTATTYTLPQGIRIIDEYAFCWAPLTEVILPDSLVEIRSYAFSACSDLQTLVLPDSITSLGGFFVYSNQRLTSVTLPAGLYAVDTAYFAFCSGLEEIVISEGTTEITSSCVYDCASLKSIVIPGSVTHITPGVFGDIPNLTLTITRNSAAYQYCKDSGVPYTYSDLYDWLTD